MPQRCFAVAFAAVMLDLRFGEPRRAHPLVAFGRFAGWLEARLYRDSRMLGLLAWMLAVLPLVGAAGALQWWLWARAPWAGMAWAALALYLALGLRSLGEHRSCRGGCA